MLGLFKKRTPDVTHQKIYIYNTLTQKKEQFEPLSKDAVTMYTCGPTVYDYVHIGNLSSYLFADILKRTLMLSGYAVNHTMNLTDFGHLTDDGDNGEDKMMRALNKAEKPTTLSAMRDLSDIYIDAFMNDLDELNVMHAHQYTRASDYVKEQIALIKTLETKGYTYETSDGIYFDISKFPQYGKLGNIDLEKLREGVRVEINKEKKHPADFALWKRGLLGWESDWGKGFPGWHIECTAMVFASLGKQIDIHTGGEDLKYTHHNGEIAQAEAATGKAPFVRYWFHNAFITIDGTKISKSLGNTITLRNLADRGYSADTFRYWILTSHYRSQSNFSFEALDGAKQALYRLKRHLFEEYLSDKAARKTKGSIHDRYREQFQQALADDLDTPKAVATLWELVRDGDVLNIDKAATLKHFDTVLGIGLSDDPDDVIRELGIIAPHEIPEDIQKLIDQREAARIARNWEEADTFREALNLKGYSVEDTPNGPRVSKEP